MKKVLSLGLGVQSTALYFMSSTGELPRVDNAIFVDLGREKKKTYEYLDFLLQWQLSNKGVPITIVRKKNLYNDLLDNKNSTGQRFSSIPAFTLNADGSKGMLRRQCTGEYKIQQVDAAIRLLHDLKPRQWTPKTEVWKGISLDEIDRINTPVQSWRIEFYPFVGYTVTNKSVTRNKDCKQLSRINIVQWYIDNHLPIPPKSSCVFCPYQSDLSWKDQKDNEPDDFEDSCKVDDAIRDSSQKGFTQKVFLLEDLIPLRNKDFSSNQLDLWKGNCSSDCHL